MKDEIEFYRFLEEITKNRPELLELTPPQLIDLVLKEKCLSDINNLQKDVEEVRTNLMTTCVGIYEELEKSSHNKK